MPRQLLLSVLFLQDVAEESVKTVYAAAVTSSEEQHAYGVHTDLLQVSNGSVNSPPDQVHTLYQPCTAQKLVHGICTSCSLASLASLVSLNCRLLSQ